VSDSAKIAATHLNRVALVYVRQSTPSQVEHNRESTQRQYQLVDRGVALGWDRQRISVIDEDLGVSGAGFAERSGFAHMTAQVALGHVGIVLGLEVSRLARNNADWYRLLDLCGATDTLIGDGDGIYHPGLFNDRLVLGLKGTMSEAELHVLRSRLEGGIRNKAARGELRRGLPIGFVWGEEDGEVRFHPDEAVIGAIRAVFHRFTEMGSARQVWLWFRSEELLFPQATASSQEISWVVPTYCKIHKVLKNPVYAGAYVYGKTRQERYVDETGQLRKRTRKLPRSEWLVFLPDHHPGFIDWDTFEANQSRLAANTHPVPHSSGGAVREGAALLQGLAMCGHCGRNLLVDYCGRSASPAYYCPGSNIANGRGEYCLRIGGRQIDHAVASALLATLAPAALEACLLSADHLQANRDTALEQWRRQVTRAHYEAQRAERRYRAVDPDNRLVARGLEAEWEKQLQALEAAEAELARRERQQPLPPTPEQREAILALHTDLEKVWSAPTTTHRDRKELLRTVIEQVVIAVDREAKKAHLTMLWRGDLVTDIDVDLPRSQPPPIRTDEDTVDLIRRLVTHYPDAVIAGILNRQGRTTATGLRYTANRVGNLRRYRGIPRFEPPSVPAEGELVTIKKAAEILGIAPSTVHRWLNDGFIAGEQITPGAPWQIRITEELRSRFIEEAPPGYVPMIDATRLLGVSRQTVLQRVKRGELEAVHIRSGRRKGLRIRVPDTLPGFSGTQSSDGV
jgi:DNA invertase Pin-like site-specific DNA recombinase